MLSFLARQFRSLAPMFRPPFDGLWIAVLLYYIWCFFVHPDSQVLRGNLPDPDDYMYLTQVLDWLKGQSWFDNVQHRLDPPAGALIPFSRLPQIPMAAVIWLFERFGLPPKGAATLMAFIEPLFLLAAFFIMLRWVAESLMPKNWAGVTAYVLLFATGLMALFIPGHIDHHGLEILLIMLALGCVLHMVENPQDIRLGIGAGVALAFGMAISLEILPWVILISGWIGLWAIAKGRGAALNGLAYGLALDIASVTFLLLTRRPTDLLTPDILVYSVVYVFLANAIAATLAGIALASKWQPIWRWAIGTSLAAVTGALFLTRFPTLIEGPYGAMNPALAKFMLDDLSESMSLTKMDTSWLRIIARTLYGWFGLGAGLWFLRHAKSNERWRWGLILLLLAAAIPMTIFYQSRFIGITAALAALPLATLLQRGWEWIGTRRWKARGKVWAEIGLLLLVGPLPAVLLPALVDGRSLNTGILLFPAHSFARNVCDMYGLEKVLHAPQLYGGKPRLIISTMGVGPELLFRTPHKVLSAPYHTSVEGNLDAVRFFATSDEAEAKSIAYRRHADLVVACALMPPFYENWSTQGTLHNVVNKRKPAKPVPPMMLRLITGHQVPDWLLRVHSPVLHNYVVYEIVPPSGSRSHKSSERE